MPRQDLRTRPVVLVQRDEFGRPYPSIRHADLPADILLNRLVNVVQRGKFEWSACCPAHNDTVPSLSLTETPEKILLVHCFAGCETAAVLKAVGLTMSFLYPTKHSLRCAGRSRPRAVSSDLLRHGDLPAIDTERWGELARKFADAPRAEEMVNKLAEQIGIDFKALRRLAIGWDDAGQRWSIPERDERHQVVGIGYRSLVDGHKSCHPGGFRGLLFPADLGEYSGPIYLPEGMTDTAAMLACGKAAVGRPMATTPQSVKRWLSRLLASHSGGQSRPIVVVGDRDDAGIAGARKLVELLTLPLELAANLGTKNHGCDSLKNTTELPYPVRWALPRVPHKDVREQCLACGDVTPIIQDN